MLRVLEKWLCANSLASMLLGCAAPALAIPVPYRLPQAVTASPSICTPRAIPVLGPAANRGHRQGAGADKPVQEVQANSQRSTVNYQLGPCRARGEGEVAPVVTEAHLPDGLTVLLKEVHAAPVVCTYVWYRVGSRNEVEPLTGISHQLEHMMFKGTKKEFPNPGYIDLLIGRYGGSNNAQTDTDTTSYYLLLPSDQLDLALRIEADRMTQAAIDPKQLRAEKSVVLSELEGDENDNSFFLYEHTRAAAYLYHPYHFPIVGTKWDVQHFTRPEVYSYYQQHYAPNNATLVVVGDFNASTILERVRSLWSGVAAHAVPSRPLDPEPPQRGERRVLVRRAGSAAYLDVFYHIPSARHPDIPSLTVLATALAGGHSSILYRALVETQLATSVSASANQGIDPELLEVAASVRTGVKPDDVEKALGQSLDGLKRTALDSRALQKAKNQTRADFIFAQDSVQNQAARLGFYQTVTGSWRHEYDLLRQINAVTAADVQRVARAYLTEDNRTVGIFQPNGEAAPPEADSGAGGRGAHYRRVGAHNKQFSATADFRHVGPRIRVSPDSQLSTLNPRPATGGSPYTQLSTPNSKLAVKQRRLANGLTVIVREDHANPTVSISGYIRHGSADDPAGKKGLASLVADMLLRGTSTRTSQQIADATDFVGAQIAVDAERERTTIGAAMLKEDFNTILDLLADALRNPSFPDEELTKVKGETVTSLQEEAQDTGAVAERRFYAALYPTGNPYAHAPEGDIPDVRAITRDDVVTFHQRAYRPDQTTLIMVGDLPADVLFAGAERAFGDWMPGGEPLALYRPRPASPSASPSPPVVITLTDKSQDDVAMGALAISRDAPDYEAASIMNLILGGDEFVGRIGKRVRDTEGLAYYAYTRFAPGIEVGPWIYRAGANPRNVPRAIASARSEVERMVASGVRASELAWAKDHAIGALRVGMATAAGIAAALDVSAFYGLGLDYSDRYPKIVRALTKPQVDAAARKYLHPSAMTTIVAGPPVDGLK